MREIVLCATQRCGSTMIVEDMRNTGVLGKPEEYFIPWDPEKTDVDWKATLESVRQRGRSDNGVMSVKVMANQLAGIEACLREFVKPRPGPLFFRFHHVFRDAAWVFISRRDVVAQAVSRLMARQTGINHATQGEDHFAGNLLKGGDLAGYNAKAVYDFDAIRTECTSIVLENLAWRRFFEAFSIEPVEVEYEDAATDTAMRHLDRIARAAEVGETEVEKGDRRIVKIGNARNQEFVDRFHTDAARRGFGG